MGRDELRDAAAAGDLDAVASELEAGCSVDSADGEGLCALHVAASAGAAEVVRYLLEKHGATIDKRCKDGRSPLHLGVGCGDLDTVQVLLSCDADPNYSAISGDTPLHAAARLPRPDVTQLLLMHGANPCATNRQGNTPLHVAAAHARSVHVQELLKAGASVNAQNSLAMTPLWMVCENGPWIEDEEAQKAESAALFVQSNELMVSGQYAAAEKFLLASNKLQIDPVEQRDCCKVASTLLQHGADVNCADTANQHTPLTVAASQADVAYQAYLRAHPPPEPAAEPQDLDADPLAFGHRVCVQHALIVMLLKAGANHEHLTEAGHTALTLTADLPTIQTLLLGKPKADVDLVSAAATGIMSAAREARDRGASLSKTISPGTSTALHIAASFGRVKTDPLKPPQASNLMVNFLIHEGANVNAARSGDKLTPLCMAAQAGHRHIVRTLLQHGADRNQPTHRGLTPLWYAARNGHEQVATILLQGSCTDACDDHCTRRHAGCRVDRANADGISPLWIAAASGHVETVHILLVHHASIDHTDNSGATPLWIACKRGHEAVAQLLAKGLGSVHHVDLGRPSKLNQMHPRANADR